ncbi:MAG: BLUF domain-containing protein, partial [Azoarcus sp.]|nr:BLUF domain-containing protein [Azoarcus sp.]
IDRAFVDGIDKSPESRAVIQAVIGLGRALGLKLVAEGVETAAQQLELCAFGCDFIQGYHFHRPLEEAVFIATVTQALQNRCVGPATSLHFLIYASQAVAPLSASAIDELINQSRAANRLLGVTGCLVHQDGHFMQMLEGDRDTLFALMDKIRSDPRHRDLRVVIEGSTPQRVFSGWAMVLRELSSGPATPDFDKWPGRTASFLDLAEDPRICYGYITAYSNRHLSA